MSHDVNIRPDFVGDYQNAFRAGQSLGGGGRASASASRIKPNDGRRSTRPWARAFSIGRTGSAAPILTHLAPALAKEGLSREAIASFDPTDGAIARSMESARTVGAGASRRRRGLFDARLHEGIPPGAAPRGTHRDERKEGREHQRRRRFGPLERQPLSKVQAYSRRDPAAAAPTAPPMSWVVGIALGAHRPLLVRQGVHRPLGKDRPAQAEPRSHHRATGDHPAQGQSPDRRRHHGVTDEDQRRPKADVARSAALGGARTPRRPPPSTPSPWRTPHNRRELARGHRRSEERRPHRRSARSFRLQGRRWWHSPRPRLSRVARPHAAADPHRASVHGDRREEDEQSQAEQRDRAATPGVTFAAPISSTDTMRTHSVRQATRAWSPPSAWRALHQDKTGQGEDHALDREKPERVAPMARVRRTGRRSAGRSDSRRPTPPRRRPEASARGGLGTATRSRRNRIRSPSRIPAPAGPGRAGRWSSSPAAALATHPPV